MSVSRVRPRGPNDCILSDEEFSDDELELTAVDSARVLHTRIGGRAFREERR